MFCRVSAHLYLRPPSADWYGVTDLEELGKLHWDVLDVMEMAAEKACRVDALGYAHGMGEDLETYC